MLCLSDCIDFCAHTVPTYASASLLASFSLCIFVCLSLVRVPQSRVNQGSSFLGGGEVIQGGGECKEGCGFQKLWAFWSAV